MVSLLEVPGLGYLLVALGVVLFLVEATMPGFFLGVPATILLLLGIFALIVPVDVFTQWAPILAIAVGIPATAVTIWMYRRMAPPDAEPTTMAASNLVGAEGIVTTDVTSDTTRGKVRLQQQSWSATAETGTIPEGAAVKVVRVDGVILIVRPIQKS